MYNSSKIKNDTSSQIIRFLPPLLATALLLVGVFIISFLLSNSTRTTTSSNDSTNSIDALVCTSNIVEKAFFNSPQANYQTHEIKVTFATSNDKDYSEPDKIFYTYYGKFVSNKNADTNSVTMHANYNQYMGEYADSLSPNFSIVGNEIKITLYMKVTNIDNKNSKLFLIDDDVLSEFANSTQKSIQKYYADKSFNCKNIN